MSEYIYFIEVEYDDSLCHVLKRGRREDCLVDIGTIRRKYINDNFRTECHFETSDIGFKDHRKLLGMPGDDLPLLKCKISNYFGSWTERRRG